MIKDPHKPGSHEWTRLAAVDRAIQFALYKPSRQGLDQEETLQEVFALSDRFYTHLMSRPKGK